MRSFIYFICELVTLRWAFAVHFYKKLSTGGGNCVNKSMHRTKSKNSFSKIG